MKSVKQTQQQGRGEGSYMEWNERGLDEVHIEEMMKLGRENPWVGACSKIIGSTVLNNGLGMYQGDEEVEGLPLPLREFLDEDGDEFTMEVIRIGLGMGYVVCTTDLEEFSMRVVDPRSVRITMYRHAYGKIKYAIRTKGRATGNEDGWGHDSNYMIFVNQAPDFETGLTSGLWSQSVRAHFAETVTNRNTLVQDTLNAHGYYVLQGNKTGGVIEKAYVHTLTDEDANVGLEGVRSSMAERIDTIRTMREESFNHDREMASHMVGSVELPFLQTTMLVPNFDPGRNTFQPVPDGQIAVQREAMSLRRDIVEFIMQQQREIFILYGVPYTMIARASGNHPETIDTEDDQLLIQAGLVTVFVQSVLRGVSQRLLGAHEIANTMETMWRLDDPDAIEAFLKTANAQKPYVIRTNGTLSLRRGMKLYEMNMVRYDAIQDAFRKSRAMTVPGKWFEEEDSRIREVELELMAHPPGGTGGGGKARSGSKTKRKIEVGTLDRGYGSKRERAATSGFNRRQQTVK